MERAMRKSPSRSRYRKIRSNPFAAEKGCKPPPVRRFALPAGQRFAPDNADKSGVFALTPASLHGTMPTGCLTPITRSHAAVPAAGRNSSLTLRPTGNTALTPAISPTGMERGRAVMPENKARAQRNYLAGVAVANDMLRRGLISEADFSALETVFAGKYRPLFRYEKPCLSPTLLITQTDEGRAKNE